MVQALSFIPARSEDTAATGPATAALLLRLGLEAFPARETRFVRIDQLIVPQAAQMARSARRLAKSIQHIGLLHAPAVALLLGADIHDDNATFEVIAGRRRVLAAQLAGLTSIKCEVYTASTPQLSSLIALVENEQRSAAWVKEVEALRRLLDEKVGLTLDDLVAFGFDRAGLAERLKVAQLPAPLVERVLAGNMNRETARKLVRLTQTQQERVARLAEAGEEITAASVKAALRAQIDSGFAPMQEQLAQAWSALTSSESTDPALHPCTPLTPASAGDERDGCATTLPKRAPSPLSTLLVALRDFEQSGDYHATPQAVRTLTTALIQQVQVCLHSEKHTLHPHSEDYSIAQTPDTNC